MMKRLWLILVASTFVLTAPYFMDSAQDLEDTENEPARKTTTGLRMIFCLFWKRQLRMAA